MNLAEQMPKRLPAVCFLIRSLMPLRPLERFGEKKVPRFTTLCFSSGFL